MATSTATPAGVEKENATEKRMSGSFDVVDAPTPTSIIRKRTVLGELENTVLQSRGSNAKKKAKKNRKSMGRRVSFAPIEMRVHVYERADAEARNVRRTRTTNRHSDLRKRTGTKRSKTWTLRPTSKTGWPTKT
eukprot:jgi/Pico_ML_1/50769/g1920.t3